MSWVKLDDQRGLHPKLCAVGFEARGLDEAVICWCAANETDGFIADLDLEALGMLHGCRPKRVHELAAKLCRIPGFAAGRWERDEENEGYVVRDFLDFNPSRHENAERRAQRAAAGRAGGLRRAERRRTNGAGP